MTRFVRSIQVVEFMDHLNAERILQKRARENPKFAFHLNHEVVSIDGHQKVESVTVKDRTTGKRRELRADGVFIWVGLIPNTDFLEGKLTLNAWGYVPTNEKMETLVSGVFAVGDVRDKHVRQITTAVGDGTIAAQSALAYVERLEEGG